MISATQPGLSWFLLVSGVVFLVSTALPLLFAPAAWGRALGWEVPSDSPFTVYLGRCLGGVATVLALFTLRAAPDPSAHGTLIEVLLATAALFTIIHIVGAIEGKQPMIENLEIGMYVLLFALGTWLYLG